MEKKEDKLMHKNVGKQFYWEIKGSESVLPFGGSWSGQNNLKFKIVWWRFRWFRKKVGFNII